MNFLQKMTIKGFCRAMNISFLAEATRIRGDNNRKLTKDEYEKCIVFAFSMRSGFSKFDDYTIVYDKSGQEINVVGKSFTDVVLWGLFTEGLYKAAHVEVDELAVRKIITDIIGEPPSI